MVEQKALNGTSTLYDNVYSYDLDGNLTSEGESYGSGLSNRTVTNGYDAINRLTSETVLGSAPNTITTYQYDAANNRLQKSVSGGSSPGITTYGYNNLNQLLNSSNGTTATTYTYDANGNRATRTQGVATDTYAYDDENRLVFLTKNTSGGAGTYAYQYDYRTRRITRTENGTTTALVFSGGTSIREYAGSASGTPTVQNIRGSDYGGGIGGILYTLRAGTPSYTHENRRGDVIAKTNGSGSLTYQAEYEGFGTRTQENGSTLDRQKANTKDEDPDGLLNEGMRYRDLETGSFITRDPAGFVDGPNEYTYVVDNPWTKFDPEGLDSSDANKPPPKPKPKSQATSAGSSSSSDKSKPVNGKGKSADPSPSARKTKNQTDSETSDTHGDSPNEVKAKGQLRVDTDGTGGPVGVDESHQNHASGVMDKNGHIVPKYLPDGSLNPAGLPKNGGRDLNANTDAYGVAPKALSTVNGGPLQPGDKEQVTTPNGTQTVPIGDFGPNARNGEESKKAVENQGYKVLPGTTRDPNPEPSPDGKTDPDIPAGVKYYPNSH